MVARQTSNLEAVGSSPTRNANLNFWIIEYNKLLRKISIIYFLFVYECTFRKFFNSRARRG